MHRSQASATHDFKDDIKKFLQEGGIDFEDAPEKFETPFGMLFIASHKLLIHCITLDPNVLNSLPPGFCMELTSLAESVNLKMIHLWEDMWYTREPLVKSRLNGMLGRNVKIHARQTRILRLNKMESDAFLAENHLLVNTSAYYKYGLVLSEKLVAVATFSKSRTMQDGVVPYRSFEWVRFASASGYTVTGGLGKLLAHFIRTHQPDHIMTYADRDWGTGESYKKLGFQLAQLMPPGVFFVRLSDKQRFYPHRLPPELIKKQTAGAPLSEVSAQPGYVKIHNAGTAKFTLDLRK